MIKDLKEEIRKTCRDRVSFITDRPRRSFLMRDALLKVLDKYEHIALFASMPSEIDTFPLIEELLKTNKHIYLPHVENDVIHFYEIKSFDDLEISNDKYRIPEPKQGTIILPSMMEVIICPGVAFDKNNHRLGHGKGFYDKFLRDTSLYKIGVCYKEQLFDEIPHVDHDENMDIIYTF